MATPTQPPHSLLAAHAAMDKRLAAVFRRYDAAYRTERASGALLKARMDLALLLWDGEDPPLPVRDQLASDGVDLLRDTPPL